MRTSTACTIVRQPPISAPSALISGRPWLTIATSVVVPPMSETAKSFRPVRNPAPTTLAAGPDRIVSTGYSRATSARISEPSPLTIISGAAIASASSTWPSASIRWRICAVRRALSAAVSARRGASSLELSSCAQVTDLRDTARISCRTRSSCAGLRTENRAATAKASTRASQARTASSTAASSSGASSSPVASWPPRACTSRLAPSRCSPERSTIASSKPTTSVQMGLKRFSTTELVASVVETDTSRIRARVSAAGRAARTARIAPAMPIDRSQCVVRALAVATTRRSLSSRTASVNVPPVSSPSHSPALSWVPEGASAAWFMVGRRVGGGRVWPRALRRARMSPNRPGI